LDGIKEVRGGLRPPFVERRRVGQAVEGVVDLNRVEGPRVVLEPPGGRELSRIEVAPPVFVLPSGAPDPHARFHRTASRLLQWILYRLRRNRIAVLGAQSAPKRYC